MVPVLAAGSMQLEGVATPVPFPWTGGGDDRRSLGQSAHAEITLSGFPRRDPRENLAPCRTERAFGGSGVPS